MKKTFRYNYIIQTLSQGVLFQNGYVLELDLGHQENREEKNRHSIMRFLFTLLGVPLRNPVEYEMEK